MLAILLAHPNQPVSVDVLVDALWGAQLDPRARQKVKLHAHRLRKVLDDSTRLTFGPGGYRLRVLPGELDAEIFEQLMDRATANPQQRVELLRGALDLWRGRPYDDLDIPILAGEAERLADRRLHALEELYTAELDRGRHTAVVAELAELARQFPLRERLSELLMNALYRAGRRVDALAAYQEARRTLVAEIGVEPGAALRAIQQQILTDEPVHAAEQWPPQSRPAQLPRAITGFVGRAPELAALTDRPTEDGLVVLAGTAGVGKTALAVHWAHQVKEQFPDGQLYVDLHGYGPEQPVSPAEALEGFLRALGVAGTAIPCGQAERSARLRSILDGRRMLIVLDNARSVEQVRPLLPGVSSCFVLITSRDALAGLAAREGAHRLILDRLTPNEAERLLRQLLGEELAGGAQPTARVIQQCARLPLALRIAAEQLRSRPGIRVTEPACERERLDLLDIDGDSYTSVRAVFSWSYRQLPSEAARLFQLFGVYPGHDIDEYALTALVGKDPVVTQRALDTLVRAHLVEETSPGRYQPHDLLRAYAAELATTDGDRAGQHAALGRLSDYYRHTAATAMNILTPHEIEFAPEHPPAMAGPVLGSYESALGWLDRERTNLVLVAERTAACGQTAYLTDLAVILWRYLDMGLYTDDAQRLHTSALAIAREREDRVTESVALSALGLLHYRMGRYAEAAEGLARSLALHSQFGDHTWQGPALYYLACAQRATGGAGDAREHRRQSFVLYRAVGSQPQRISPLINLGFAHQRLGQYRQAFRCFRRAHAVAEESGNRLRQAYALLHLAEVCRESGRVDEALQYSYRTLALARKSGIHSVEGQILRQIGSSAPA
ncbi:DNA-binding SARP family transcriptional activator [Tamaricihabitans halophyticus]|uniref:DNA-binding SARP family transcriptional activator n=2 Tax=Tamaricihabitans halophyticus TaxID=1262583 RepID=A0A4R2R3R4_9PSEU|nr:DNA-binding SARP family transcriptional activator [Tamaricihabitans halophyticus]